MKDVAQIDTCLGYGDGIDVFYNEGKLREAQREINEECAAQLYERDIAVVVIEIPTRSAALDLEGIGELRSALDKAEATYRERMKSGA